MITIQNKIDLPDTYPLKRLGKIGKILFFDIETTGFSGDFSNLYLIGCTYYRDGSWNLVQWFADTSDSETGLLHAFFQLLEQFSVLVHFNGDGFDIPYLLKRCQACGLRYDFSSVQSIDIYKKIRPYKSLLQLENIKQKTLEQFLGISRTDQYSGGQLIEVYQEYLITHEAFLYELLILHNEEDLKGMPSILPILNYPDFLEQPFTLKKQKLVTQTDIFGSPHYQLELTFENSFSIPVPFQCACPELFCKAEKNRVVFLISLYEGELKYYYPNYKDYYYLIFEDTAVHKSVGEYVAKDAKKKATAKTCYTRKKGLFLPQFQPLWEPALRKNYKDKVSYVELSDSLFQNEPDVQTYQRQLLDFVRGQK